MASTELEKKFHEVGDALIWKWQQPDGRDLIREGAKIVTHLINHGPLPPEVADAMLPAADQDKGMVEYFAARDYDLEVNAAGDIVGAGISLICDHRSAVHISEINGRRFYNWCVCDIVMFPIILGVESPCSTVCPATKERITFTVTPTGFDELSHPGAWFTLAPAHGGEIRKVYCDRVNIYRDKDAAVAAATADPDIACAPIAELWTDTKKLADMF
ncbi:organomercurial lyase [Nocardia sp. NPDC050712]|uniref:organomercurial lyase n=1 Tax=Nocardia sp. NPDC050712 TaxID=3155518 RepID=UPI0033E9A7F7